MSRNISKNTNLFGIYCGKWKGYYIQGIRKYPQEMTLEFVDRVLQGHGTDGLGTFRIEGEFGSGEPGSEDIPVGWIKTYDDAHSVLYLGLLRNGTIHGHWEINTWASGKFKIRPSSL